MKKTSIWIDKAHKVEDMSTLRFLLYSYTRATTLLPVTTGLINSMLSLEKCMNWL